MDRVIFIKVNIIIISLLFIHSCQHLSERPDDSAIAGSYHVVKPGDTLAKLAKTYRVPKEEIMEINGIDNERQVPVGRALFMPDPDPIGKKIAHIRQKPGIQKKNGKTANQPTTKPNQNSPTFDFPVPGGTVVYRFSKAKDRPYDGIGIKAALGTDVISAQDGRILYVGNEGTKFGLLVIIEHLEPFITVYAHLDRAKVSTGQPIKRGQPVGTVGKSGGVSLPHLHFQIRIKERPENPEAYLRI